METIKAIIFDWGGVLIEEPSDDLLEYCSRAAGVEFEELRKIHQRFEADLNTAAMSEMEFWQRVCAIVGRGEPPSRSLWGEAIRRVYKPRPEMFSLVSKLHVNGYKTALLSNTELPVVDFFHLQHYDCFDAAIFSCIERTRKPAPEIYEIVLQQLGVLAREAVFLDDKTKYVEGARNVGLQAFQYASYDGVVAQLRGLSVNT